MALIKCPECGREISDKAVSCPGCGCPVSQFENVDYKDDKADKLMKTVKRIHRIYPNEKTKAIKELRKCTDLSLGEAISLIDKEYKGEGIGFLSIEYTERNSNTSVSTSASKNIEKDDYKKGGIFTKIKCPKCSSVEYQVIDTKKKFSVGKSLAGNTVGGLVFGPVGAIVGAATGIQGKNGKTKFVCSHCGKVWEQKV